MTLDLLKMWREGSPAGDGGTPEASTGSAGAQPRGDRTARQDPGRERPWKSGETVMVTLRLRRPVVEAVAAAVDASPIEFGSAADFYRRAIEHELQRRGLLKTYK